MSPRPILWVLWPSCHEHNDKTNEAILCDAPDCFNGVMDRSDGHMGYIFQPDDSTVKTFTNGCLNTPFQTKTGSFSPALRMREWLMKRRALCQIKQVPSGTSRPGVRIGRGSLWAR